MAFLPSIYRRGHLLQTNLPFSRYIFLPYLWPINKLLVAAKKEVLFPDIGLMAFAALALVSAKLFGHSCPFVCLSVTRAFVGRQLLSASSSFFLIVPQEKKRKKIVS